MLQAHDPAVDELISIEAERQARRIILIPSESRSPLAVRQALGEYSGPAPDLWLYRGAWQEWPVSEATVLVPLSESELRRKILAIFKHQSQKDKAPFPGADEREFWQRTEQRNRGTADLLARLGLPAYYAMEAYVVERDGTRVENPPAATSTLVVGG